MDCKSFLAEFIGTAVFLTIILKSKGDKYVIVLGLLAAILLLGSVSGGHFNPAVSLMFLLKKDDPSFTTSKCGGYIVAQALGAMCALSFAKYFP
jgi:glycerol uptake facilitator-like aquaporin